MYSEGAPGITEKPTPPSFVIISMVSQFFLSLVLFVSLTYAQPSSISSAIQQACKATRFPTTCESSLISYPHDDALNITAAAMTVANSNTQTAHDNITAILNTDRNPNIIHAAKKCIDLLEYSLYETQFSFLVFADHYAIEHTVPPLRLKDARVWISTALQYQYDCRSELNQTNDNTKLVNETMSYLDTAMLLTSNAISILLSFDIYGNDTARWAPPKTERDGFWEAGGSTVGLGAGIPDFRANVTVCKHNSSSGCYNKIQDAVNAAGDKDWSEKFGIYIKEGVYEETVRVTKPNMVFLGDGMGRTVITGSLNGVDNPTVGVEGDEFMAIGLTIQNTAGPDAQPAVAFKLMSDLAIIVECEFLGNQGTLYTQLFRQFYKSCRIEGNVDFIFGNSAAVFQDCQILVRPRQLKPEEGEKNTITANGRLDPAQPTGFVFQNCLINGTEEYMGMYNGKPQVHNTFLGRPWNEYSRTVFINCTLEALVSPQGWMPWDGDFALKTLYFAEYGNTGPGSNLSQRVPWSSLIPAEHIQTYSVDNFILGDNLTSNVQKIQGD